MTPRLNDWRENYLHVERSRNQLQRDLVIAFDRIDRLEQDRRNLKNWLKVFGGIITVEGALLGWFATSLLSCLESGAHLSKFFH